MGRHEQEEPIWVDEGADWSAYTDELDIDDESFARAILDGRRADFG